MDGAWAWPTTRRDQAARITTRQAKLRSSRMRAMSPTRSCFGPGRRHPGRQVWEHRQVMIAVGGAMKRRLRTTPRALLLQDAAGLLGIDDLPLAAQFGLDTAIAVLRPSQTPATGRPAGRSTWRCSRSA